MRYTNINCLHISVTQTNKLYQVMIEISFNFFCTYREDPKNMGEPKLQSTRPNLNSPRV